MLNHKIERFYAKQQNTNRTSNDKKNAYVSGWVQYSLIIFFAAIINLRAKYFHIETLIIHWLIIKVYVNVQCSKMTIN